MKPRVTVVILTLNEERNLAACLDSLAGFDDVHLLDCGSTDNTAALAAARNVRVWANPFTGFGSQRNWAIDHIPAAYDWHFHLDADERMTPGLTAELARVTAEESRFGGYHIPSKLMFAGKWLKRAGQYPGYQVRFFHKAKVRFADHGHGQREIASGPIGYLTEPMLHYGFSKGIDHWFVKHIGYARREAEAARVSAAGGRLLTSDPVARRRWLKGRTARLPGRYLLRLGYMMFVRRAVFDGWAGVTYAHMLATYDGMIDVYSRLLRHGVHPDDGV